MSTEREANPVRAAANPAAPKRERLRFTGFSLERSPSGRVTCQVSLEFSPGETITGRAEGQASPAGDSRRRTRGQPGQGDSRHKPEGSHAPNIELAPDEVSGIGGAMRKASERYRL